MYDVLLIRYGELTTKWKNRFDFINNLYNNIEKQLINYLDQITIIKNFDLIFIEFKNNEIIDTIIENFKNVFGIYSISLAVSIDKDIEILKQKTLQLVSKYNSKTFKLESKRTDKSFMYSYNEIKQQVGQFIEQNHPAVADMINPELKINIEVRKHKIYFYNEKIKGLGGLPVGISGKALVMISGGIDSPVASFLTMKRGMSLEYIHFITPGHTDEKALFKVKTLIQQLTYFSKEWTSKLHVVDFSKLQHEIMHIKDESYRITIMRRIFYRIANIIAKKQNAKALIAGESLGQVASQTVESINTINNVSDLIVFRPLIAYDKEEIIALAIKINTYKTSILPFEDCCSLFVPKNPVTKPINEIAIKQEKDVMWEELIALIIKEYITTYEISGIKKESE